MMDEMARKLIVYTDPGVLTLVAEVAPSDEEIADFLAVLWHRALYGGPPIDQQLGPAARSIAGLWVERASQVLTGY
jgi:hypothetical protein